MYSLFFFPKLRASTIQWFIIMFPLHCFFWYTQFQEKTNVVAVQALLAYQYTPIQQSRYIHQTKLLLYTKLSTKLPNDLTAQWPTVDGCEIRSSPVKMWKKTSHDFGCGFQPSLWGCGISSTIVLEVIGTKWTRFPMWGTTLYHVFFPNNGSIWLRKIMGYKLQTQQKSLSPGAGFRNHPQTGPAGPAPPCWHRSCRTRPWPSFRPAVPPEGGTKTGKL